MSNLLGLRLFWPIVVAVLAAATGVILMLAVVQQQAYVDQATAAERDFSEPNYSVAVQPNVLFFGDSYTGGTGTSDKSLRFSTLLSTKEGWTEFNYSRGGTGYSTISTAEGCGPDGPPCPNYTGVIKETSKERPDIIVVSGGRNDYPVPASTERSAVTAFFTSLRAAFPKTTIYVTSPIWDASNPPPVIAQIQSDVKTAAKRVDATYLDIGEPLKGKPGLVTSDNIHPNDAGHAAIAAAIEDALFDVGVKPE